MERPGILHAIPSIASAVDSGNARGGAIDRGRRSAVLASWLESPRCSIHHVPLFGDGERAVAQLLGSARGERWWHADSVPEKCRHHGRFADDRRQRSRQVVFGPLALEDRSRQCLRPKNSIYGLDKQEY